MLTTAKAKIYGPYLCSDGRRRVIIGQRCLTYARYLLEQKLGRKLTFNEEADHIDNDFTNDSIENLQILSGAANKRKANKPAEYGLFICPNCKKEIKGLMRQYRGNQLKQNKAGPYCSRRCAGKIHN